MTARRLVIAAALAVAGFAMTTEAEAYVRERTDAGAALSWHGTNCLPIVAYPSGFSYMTADEVATATTGAAAAWSHGANACTYLTLTTMVSTDAGPVAIPQPHAAVVFREAQWCKVEPDGTCSTKAKDNASYDEAVLLLTSTAVNTNTGQILEGATEVNAHDYQWADLALHPATGLGFLKTQDLQNGLTHEFGHFIGLDHTCAPTGTDPWPVDDMGNPVPDCDNVSAAVQATTMFPSADPGDLSKRTLEPDDINGVCGIYPVAQDPGVCAPPAGISPSSSGCSCSAATSSGTSSLVGGALAALAIALGLRARSRRRGAAASR